MNNEFKQASGYAALTRPTVLKASQVADAQVPDSFTRDTELASTVANYLPLTGGTLSGNLSLSSGSTVDGYDISATLADINNISGTLSASKIDSAIARDSEINSLVTSIAGGVITSGTVKEAYIDSTIARDSEINSEVTSISGGAISSGTVNASYIDSAMTTDSELSSAISSLNSSISSVSSSLGNYLPLSGGTMSGEITTSNGYPVGSTLDEHTTQIANHENRITDLEGNEIDESDIPQSLRPFAYGVVDTNGTTQARGAYNLSASAYLGTVVQTITFSNPASNADYVVQVTASSYSNLVQPCLAVVTNKSTTEFHVEWNLPKVYSGSSTASCGLTDDSAYSVLVFILQ